MDTGSIDTASIDGEPVEVIDSDGESDVRDEVEAPDEAELGHQSIIAKAADAAPGPSMLHGLVKSRLGEMARPTRENRTFLHTAAANADPPERFPTLIRQVLAFPAGASLMGDKDNDKRTPLYVAINGANRKFLRAATNWPSDSVTARRVRAALEEAEGASGETTSLHLAVTKQHKITHAILMGIIRVAPRSMFRVQDTGGHTPLHLAVEHARCSGDQLAVVQALIERDPSALEMTTAKGHSVYQHHVHSCQPAAPKDAAGHPASGRGATAGRPPPSNQPLDRHQDPRASGAETGQGVKQRRPDMAPGSDAGLPTPTFNIRLVERNLTNMVLEPPDQPSRATTDSPVDPQSRGPAVSRPVRRSTHPRVSDPAVEQIRDELKLQSLRVMPCDVASRCLHIDNKDEKHLWFDYVPSPQTQMTFKQFEAHWAHLDFDSTLQYVALPDVTFRPGQDEDQLRRRGRDDASRILRWLHHSSRGVERVLRVIVHEPDGGGNYHSNEAIEASLKNFHVEVLDWRRPDICPSTIVSIGADLRELHLHWSGNNAVLRAWSELQGLPMLARYKKLERIRIIVPEGGPDICSRTQRNLTAFRTRLKTNWTTMAELFGKVWEETAVEEVKATNRLYVENATDTSETKAREAKYLLLEKLLERLTAATTPRIKEMLPDEAQGGLDVANGEASNGTNGRTEGSAAPSQPPPKPQPKAEPPKLPKPPVIEVDDSSGRNRFPPLEAEDGASQGAPQEPKRHIEQHRWIEVMKDFSAAFKEVPQPTEREVAQHAALAPIKVALIDDGVDTTSPSLQGRTYRGKSFDFYDDGQRSQPYWVSKAGHGTVMARLIRGVCPTADIYVIKLSTDASTKDLDRLTIDADSAIKAIHHALDQNAKIISMSWSVKAPSPGAEQDRWQKVISRAISSQAILLCAASDQGEAGAATYPYAANQGYIFSVGAATPHARPADYVKPGDVHFLFPGHDVLPEGDGPGRGLGGAQSGSSVATALAAGLAATVLECVRLGYLGAVRARRDGRELPARHVGATDVDVGAEGMKSIFLMMTGPSRRTVPSRASESDSWYVKPWEWFRPEDNEKLRDSTPSERLEHVMALAQRFVDMK